MDGRPSGGATAGRTPVTSPKVPKRGYAGGYPQPGRRWPNHIRRRVVRTDSRFRFVRRATSATVCVSPSIPNGSHRGREHRGPGLYWRALDLCGCSCKSSGLREGVYGFRSRTSTSLGAPGRWEIGGASGQGEYRPSRRLDSDVDSLRGLRQRRTVSVRRRIITVDFFPDLGCVLFIISNRGGKRKEKRHGRP
jgi:hypothetical protein